MTRRISELRNDEQPGADPPSTDSNDWLKFWRRPAPRKDPDPFAGARIRVFVRRDASRETVDALRAMLGNAARGRWQAVPFHSWTAVDLELIEDLNLIRALYARSIDGWQNLEGL